MATIKATPVLIGVAAALAAGGLGYVILRPKSLAATRPTPTPKALPPKAEETQPASAPGGPVRSAAKEPPQPMPQRQVVIYAGPPPPLPAAAAPANGLVKDLVLAAPLLALAYAAYRGNRSPNSGPRPAPPPATSPAPAPPPSPPPDLHTPVVLPNPKTWYEGDIVSPVGATKIWHIVGGFKRLITAELAAKKYPFKVISATMRLQDLDTYPDGPPELS